MTAIEEAEALFQKGKLKEAEERFLALAQAGPLNKRVFNTLGVIAFQQQDLLGAITRFTRSLQIDPYYKTTLVNMSHALRPMNRLAEIVGLLGQYSDRYPDDAEIRRLGVEARREGLKPIAYSGIAQGRYQTVGILMITKNHLPALKHNLPALLANTLIPYELTIVDNNSTDGTVEWLRQIEDVIPVKHSLIFNPTKAGMFEATQTFYEQTPCRYLVRVTPETDFHPGWLMELYHKYENVTGTGDKFWLSRNVEQVHKSLRLKRKSHLRDRRQYALFYEEQGHDVGVTRYGQERMFHPEGNPRLNYVADCAEGDCLDVGCQYGAYAIWLAKQGHNVYALDLSSSFLKEARHRLASEPEEVRGRITLLQSWAEHLPFKEHSFQTALLSEILEHVREPEKVLGEALRVLKPGGVLYLSMPGYADDTLEHVRVYTEDQITDLLNQYSDVLDIQTLQWYYRQPNDHFMLALRKKKEGDHTPTKRLEAPAHA